MKKVLVRNEDIRIIEDATVQQWMIWVLASLYSETALDILASQSHRVEVAGYMESPSEITYRQGVYNAELLDKHVAKLVKEGYNWIEMTLTIYYTQGESGEDATTIPQA
jgi:hypothetical protein